MTTAELPTNRSSRRDRARLEQWVVERQALVMERDVLVAERDALKVERDRLLASHERLRLELELLKHRLFIAKAERVDTAQLEMEFAAKLRELEESAGTLDMPSKESVKARSKPKGRRDLSELGLPEVRVEVKDEALEQLVEEGKATRHGVEESRRLMHQRAGKRVVVTVRTKYRMHDDDGQATVQTAPMPDAMFPGSIAAPSMIAHIIASKICDGLPLYRLEDRLKREGIELDRGTMSRWLMQAGETFGNTVIEAMRRDAMANAFCIATDATGIAVQPIRTHEKTRQPCKKGHFLVQVADKDAIFFEYLARETSAAIGKLFTGYTGYVQADAKSVFDALFEPPDEGEGRSEVGCWSHARRYFWEAATAKSVAAREALMRIGRIFELDASWAKKSPSERKRLRDEHLRPHVDAFFVWATVEFEKVKDQRGLLCSAFGYATRQREGLCRFFDDGRLGLDNNRSERALRSVAIGRKNWLFAGSDDHAASTAHLFTLVASARLHGLDPEEYLRDLIYVLPFWPRDRFLELAPKNWEATRKKLDPSELATETVRVSLPPA